MENLNAEQIRYKMSEKQIKTALECLSKPNSSPADREKCYFMWKEPSCLSCHHEVAQNALALINSQEQRIKELTEENERLRCEVADLKIIDKEYLPKEAIENRKEVRECKCGARFSAFVADKTDLLCAKCKHERGIIANEN